MCTNLNIKEELNLIICLIFKKINPLMSDFLTFWDTHTSTTYFLLLF